MRLALVAAFAGAALAAAQAQEFPTRAITIVVGIAAGGVTDVTTRQYAEVVSQNIGQPLVIENRPVAGGAVAAAGVQNAQPDGYTLLTVVGSQFASLPAMGPTGYDPVKGFAPITLGSGCRLWSSYRSTAQRSQWPSCLPWERPSPAASCSALRAPAVPAICWPP
jgi:tripartite-type tricarboxylate transporter receptor subunit TctC